MEYYNDKIQTSKIVIENVLSHLKNEIKMLVFGLGLGYDSELV